MATAMRWKYYVEEENIYFSLEAILCSIENTFAYISLHRGEKYENIMFYVFDSFRENNWTSWLLVWCSPPHILRRHFQRPCVNKEISFVYCCRMKALKNLSEQIFDFNRYVRLRILDVLNKAELFLSTASQDRHHGSHMTKRSHQILQLK